MNNRYKQNLNIWPQNSGFFPVAAIAAGHNYIGQQQINPTVLLEHIESSSRLWNSGYP